MQLLPANRRKQARALRVARNIRTKIINHTKGATREEATNALGLAPNDIAYLRAGNGVSLLMIVRLIKEGRYSPNSILGAGPLRKLPKGSATRGATAKLITKRVREIALKGPPLGIAKKTGLAAVTVYQFRTKPPATVSLQTLISFIEAGYDGNELLLGKTK